MRPKPAEMWVCRMIVKIVSEIATDLYDLHTVSFILSVGSVSESLQLLDILDEDEGLWIDLKWNLLLNKYSFYDTDSSLNTPIGHAQVYACNLRSLY